MQKNPVGRPTKYSQELALSICSRIAGGESLRDICSDPNMPNRSSVHLWIIEHKEFSDQYEISCNIRAENMADELFEIADDGQNDFMEKENKDGSTYTTLNSENIQRSRLRTDVRKWYLSKIMPKKYGDKLDLTSAGEKIENITKINYITPDGNNDKTNP